MVEIGALTIAQALTKGTEQLSGSGILGARNEVERLLCHLLACKRHELFIRANEPLQDSTAATLFGYIKRRQRHEPLQYIVGSEEFRGLEFMLTRHTLIPRPETEILVEQAVALESEMVSDDVFEILIDLCTGSGCVAIALAKEIASCVVYATDISDEALKTARENAETHNVSNRIVFRQGDLFEPLKPFGLMGKASFVIANPPYISTKDFDALEPEIKDYEPRQALLAGDDGLEFYRRIIPASLVYLRQGGYLMLEIGYNQANAVLKIVKENATFDDVEFIRDMHGIDRVLRAKKRVDCNAPQPLNQRLER